MVFQVHDFVHYEVKLFLIVSFLLESYEDPDRLAHGIDFLENLKPNNHWQFSAPLDEYFLQNWSEPHQLRNLQLWWRRRQGWREEREEKEKWQGREEKEIQNQEENLGDIILVPEV